MSKRGADTDDPAASVAKGYKAQVRYLNAENLRILDSENLSSSTRDHPSVYPYPGDEVLRRERMASLLSDRSSDLGGKGLTLDQEYHEFKPMPTIPATTFSILASLAMILAVFIVPQFCVPNPKGDTSDHSPDLCPVHPFSLLIYCHTGYWLLHLVVDIYLKKCHKTNRLQGYLLFYRDTKNSRRAPFFVACLGNFLFLLVDSVLNEFCHSHEGGCKDASERFNKVDWLRGLVTVECMAIMALFGFYIRKIRIFNGMRAKPDVMRPEILHNLRKNLTLKFPETPQHQYEPTFPGETKLQRAIRQAEGEMSHLFGNSYKEEDSSLRQMQAELIDFLGRQVMRKNRKIVTLTCHLAEFTKDYPVLIDIEFQTQDRI